MIGLRAIGPGGRDDRDLQVGRRLSHDRQGGGGDVVAFALVFEDASEVAGAIGAKAGHVEPMLALTLASVKTRM